MRSRLAKLSNWKVYLPLAAERADLIPYQAIKNGGEHAKQVLAHGIEEAEVLRQEIVDRLIHELQEIGLHCARLLRR